MLNCYLFHLKAILAKLILTLNIIFYFGCNKIIGIWINIWLIGMTAFIGKKFDRISYSSIMFILGWVSWMTIKRIWNIFWYHKFKWISVLSSFKLIIIYMTHWDNLFKILMSFFISIFVRLVFVRLLVLIIINCF